MRRTAICSVLLAAFFLLAPKGADAIVFKDQQELDAYWNNGVKVLLDYYKNLFNANRELSVAEVSAFSPESPGTGRGLRAIYENSAARIYTGLVRHAQNAEALSPAIPASRAHVRPTITAWKNQCDRYNDVVKLVVDQLAPIQKQLTDYKFGTEPTKDFSDRDIFGILTSDVNWFSQGGGGVYIGTPISLLASMVGDGYWTNDRNHFGHPCVYAWMIAVVASRPDSHPDVYNRFSTWNIDDGDTYLSFESMAILPQLCERKGVAEDDCFPRAFYTMNNPLPPDGAMQANIGLVILRLNELIKQYGDLAKSQQGELDAIRKAQEEARLAAERAGEAARSRLGSGSVASLSLPFSDIKVPEMIGRIINALLGIVGALALAFFVYGGFTYMTAGGSEERVDRGKKTIIWAVLGLVAIFSAYAVLNFIITALAK